ncbi:MAG TPA: Crp/Fnr family transcriptional regulator [Pirellulales bacterium]|jgi:CRP-like cAMP-binding protein|nr:Crp/Fnr family transcriptional regulator [Pirellulales bacterium]
MLLKSQWAAQFVKACSTQRSAIRQVYSGGGLIYSTIPAGRCWAVKTGYVKLIDPRPDGNRFVRLILGRGSLLGDRPFEAQAFRGFSAPQDEQAVAHGPAEVIELDRTELENAAQQQPELARLLLELAASRAQFLERRLLWQFTTPVRARIAAALRDLICFEGQRCRHGHTIDVRLTQQELAELIGAARPVVSAELARMRKDGLVEYTRGYICVEDLAGLNRIATA